MAEQLNLFLAGGGTHREEAEVWRRACQGQRRMLYLPLASTEEDKLGAKKWLGESLADLGIEVEVDAWLTLEGKDPDDLWNYDMLFVGGGYTSYLAREINENGFAEPIRRFVREGHHYYGGSAGALVVCQDVSSAASLDDDSDAEGMTGLGILENLSILPHSDVFPPESAIRIARTYDVPVLAIPEGAGVFVTGKEFWAIGESPVTLVEPSGAERSVREQKM